MFGFFVNREVARREAARRNEEDKKFFKDEAEKYRRQYMDYLLNPTPTPTLPDNNQLNNARQTSGIDSFLGNMSVQYKIEDKDVVYARYLDHMAALNNPPANMSNSSVSVAQPTFGAARIVR